MLKQDYWDLVGALEDEISFASRKKVGIQAADLLAREAMKHRDNQIGPKRRDTRRSIAALSANNRFRFLYHTRESFDLWHKEAVEMGNLKGSKMTEYRTWLDNNKLNDTFSSRLIYLDIIRKMNPDELPSK